MNRAILLIDRLKLECSIRFNTLLGHIWIINEANFVNWEEFAPQMNIALEEPNIIKSPIFEHPRNIEIVQRNNEYES